jgi:hypothetical protein
VCQAHFAGQAIGCVGHRRDLRDLPLFAFLRQAQAADRAIGPTAKRAIGRSDRHLPAAIAFMGNPAGMASSRKLAERWLRKTCRRPEPSISAASGFPSPLKSAQTNCRMPETEGKGVCGKECAVAVVSQHKRKAGRCAYHNVQVAVGLDVHRPGAGVGRTEQSRRKLCLPVTSVNAWGESWRRNRRPPAPASTRSVLKS